MVLRQSAIYLVAKAVPGFVNFLSAFLFSRMVAPNDYGVFALIFANVMIANTVAQVWIRTSLVRLYPEHSEEPGRLIGTVQWLDRMSNVAAIVIGLLGLLYFQGADRGFWVAGIVLFMLQTSQEIGLELERARMQSKQFAINSSLRSILRLVITLVLLKMGWGVWGLLVGAGVATFVPNVYAWYSVWRFHPARLDRDIFRSLVGYGLPLLGVYALDSIIGQGSRIILNHYQGTTATGLYSMVLDLLKQIVQIAVLGVNLAIFPLALRKFKDDDPEGAKEVLKRGISFSLALSLPLALVFAAAPDQSSIVFGAKYRAAAPGIMPAIAFAMLLAGLKQFYFDLAFQFGYKTNQQFGINLVAAIVSLGLNVALIPSMGLPGIAWATLATYVVATGLSAWKGRAVFAMPWPWRETVMVAVASAAMIAAIRLASHAPAAVALMLGALVYGVVLLGTDYLGLRSKVTRKVLRAG